jgi:neurofibromin 1
MSTVFQTQDNFCFQICLNTSSPPIYHQVLVCSIHRIITQKRLPWWPQVTMLYSKSNELRELFTKSLNYVMQTGCMSQHSTLKMIESLKFGNPLKFATGKGGGGSSNEEGGFQKHLLLCIVRLINADPLLMLNNQVSSVNHIAHTRT